MHGLTLMPGLVEGTHIYPSGFARRNSDLGDIPPEEHLLLTMRMLRCCSITNSRVPTARPAQAAPRCCDSE